MALSPVARCRVAASAGAPRRGLGTRRRAVFVLPSSTPVAVLLPSPSSCGPVLLLSCAPSSVVLLPSSSSASVPTPPSDIVRCSSAFGSRPARSFTRARCFSHAGVRYSFRRVLDLSSVSATDFMV